MFEKAEVTSVQLAQRRHTAFINFNNKFTRFKVCYLLALEVWRSTVHRFDDGMTDDGDEVCGKRTDGVN
jgi:hypothetical protein